MNQVAFITRHAPHGTAHGREGLDAVLATSALTEELALFFIEDGVYQLLDNQQPDGIGQRHYAPTYRLLELYDIEQVYVCAEALRERGLTQERLLIPVTVLERDRLTARWLDFPTRIMF